MTRPRVDVAAVMAGLKDFQRATVEHAFHRLFEAHDSTHRFLVADEVGLGKTMVARGVVAKAIEYLQARNVDRIDVVYICSNAEIARQNISRLAVAGDEVTAVASRLTLLPSQVHELEARKLNLIALTPATSFDHGSAMGIADERILLYGLLSRAWSFGDDTGAKNVLQGTVVDQSGFRQRLRDFDLGSVNEAIAARFTAALVEEDQTLVERSEPALKARFEAMCDEYRRKRKLGRLPWEIRSERSKVIAELRSILAATCVEALEPDLVILDEFQRFKKLLTDDESDAARLARKLFEWRSADGTELARVLMLSATPYRMYTVRADGQGDDHHEDFLATVEFLAGKRRADALRGLLRRYKAALLSADPASSLELTGVQREIEAQLTGVIARTERLAVSGDRNGMLVERLRISRPTANDVRGYLHVQQVAHELGQPDTIEYWKSAPYLLNFMEGYELRRQFDRALEDPPRHAALASILRDSSSSLLDSGDLEEFTAVDHGSARLRELASDVIGSGAWRLLWVPPAMPYYRLRGAYAEEALASFTKRLVFSAWRAVPRSVAGLLSYLAEREISLRADPKARNTPVARAQRANRLRFARQEERLTGMPILALLSPSPALATLADPLEFARLTPNAPLPDVQSWAAERASIALRELPAGTGDGPEDQRWYWAAPLLLDRAAGDHHWWSDPDLAAVWTGTESFGEEEGGLWREHVALAASVVADGLSLGRRPADLADVVGLLAIAAPGVCALRALGRATGAALDNETVRDSAAWVGWSLRTIFNTAEASTLIATEREEVRWRSVILHAADGCLQAVLDEYAHMLLESEGLQARPDVEAAEGIAEAMVEAMTLRASRTSMAEYNVADGAIDVRPHFLHAAFAARFGEDEGGFRQAGDGPTRPAQLRAAFNSPFWPFVLVSTSVGQEGLDFHPYCHAVVHWNLPTNPIDLEQREGRVHRYKNHAVRRNVGTQLGAAAVQAPGDPWTHAFELAARDRDPTDGDLVPFWVYPIEDGAQIERHVLALPLSREIDRLEALRSQLAVYRLAFGQARQDDVVAHLIKHLGAEGARVLAARLRIDLRPPVDLNAK